MEVLKVFVKEVEGKDGKKFSKKLGAFAINEDGDDSLVVDVRITQKLEPKYTADFYNKGLHYPVALSLEEEDYFIKEESYLNREGEEVVKFIVFIRDYRDIAQGTYTPKNYEKKTLTSIFKEKYEG